MASCSVLLSQTCKCSLKSPHSFLYSLLSQTPPLLYFSLLLLRTAFWTTTALQIHKPRFSLPRAWEASRHLSGNAQCYIVQEILYSSTPLFGSAGIRSIRQVSRAILDIGAGFCISKFRTQGGFIWDSEDLDYPDPGQCGDCSTHECQLDTVLDSQIVGTRNLKQIGTGYRNFGV